MVFSSIPFLFFFMPLCLLLYYAVPYSWKNGVLLLFSLVFYAWGEPVYILLMLFASTVDYTNGRLMTRFGSTEGRRRLFLCCSVIINLSVLGFFKYADFLIDTVNGLFHTGLRPLGLGLPVGISFFTFQTMSYSIDLYRRKVPVEKNYLTYLTYVSMFPQLVAGPIVRFSTVNQELHSRKIRRSEVTDGFYRFLQGLFKKVLIANQAGALWEEIRLLETGQASAATAWLGAAAFTLQLYFDFSGYCNMARGLGWLFGIEIPVNFNSPYKAVSIVDFWKRWHITLSRFFTKNVYIPLGGNRKGRGRMYFNLFLIYLLSGIWHGAGWTFVLWSVTQGVLYIVTRMWQLHQKEKREKSGKAKAAGPVRGQVVKVAGVLFTFVYFSLTCVFFRSETVGQALEIFRHLFTGGIALPAEAMMQSFNLDEFWYVIKLLHLDSLPYSQMYLGGIITVVTMAVVFFAPNADEVAVRFRPKAWNALVTAGLFLWCVLSLSGVSSFLYFNF